MRERGEVVFGEILLDEETVDGGGHAESRDLVLRDEGKQVGGGESAVVVVGEHRAAGYPLAVYLTPAALRPARFRGGEMQTVVHHFLPEARVEHESRGILEVVLHHLGHAGGAGREVAKHGIVPCRTRKGRQLGRHGVHALVEAAEPLDGESEETLLYRLAPGERVQDMFHHVLFGGGDQHLDAGGIAAVDDVFRRQQMSCGDNDRAEFAACDDQHPVLPSAVEHAHDVVALLHARGDEEVDGAVARLADVGECHDFFFSGGVAPYERTLVGRDSCVFVHHVVAEVEAFGHGKSHVFREIVVIGEIGAVEEFVKQIHNDLLSIVDWSLFILLSKQQYFKYNIIPPRICVAF